MAAKSSQRNMQFKTRYVEERTSAFVPLEQHEFPIKKDGIATGYRLDIYKGNIHLNVLNLDEPNYLHSEHPYLTTINRYGDIGRLSAKKTTSKEEPFFGLDYEILHNKNYDADTAEHYIIFSGHEDGAISVYGPSFQFQYRLHEGVMRFIDSTSSVSQNFSAIVTHDLVDDERHHTESKESLFIFNKSDLEHRSYKKVCNTSEQSEFMAVTSSREHVYLLEYKKHDNSKYETNFYSIYTIDPITGDKIGRADLALFEDIVDEPKKYGPYMAFRYFETGVEYYDNSGTAPMYANGSIYSPHDYHDTGRLVKAKNITSCNGAMPCSQYVDFEEVEQVIKKKEIPITGIGIDWIRDDIIAISYMSTQNHDKYKWDKPRDHQHHDGQTDPKPPDQTIELYHHIDMMKFDHEGMQIAYDKLDIRDFENDLGVDCYVVPTWTLSEPYTASGTRLAVTERFIAVPMLTRQIYREVVSKTHAVIALYDRETNAYAGHIKIDNDNTYDHTILDINADCSKIVVSVLVNDSIMVHVFDDDEWELECDHDIYIPVCDRAESRSWRTGIAQPEFLKTYMHHKSLLTDNKKHYVSKPTQ